MPTSILAISLAGNYEVGSAALAGLVGAVAMLVVMYGGRAMGMTSMDLLRTLGSMVLPKGAKNAVYGIGAMMHLMMGAAFGLVHAGLLHAAGPTSDGAAAGVGALLGFGHGVMVAFAMPVMLTMAHPLVRSGEIPAPGVAMTGFGKMTPLGVVMAHAVFGLVAGAIYTAAVG